jgi:hypothetical protein
MLRSSPPYPVLGERDKVRHKVACKIQSNNWAKECPEEVAPPVTEPTVRNLRAGSARKRSGKPLVPPRAGSHRQRTCRAVLYQI